MNATTDGTTTEEPLLSASEASEMLDHLESATTDAIYNATEGRIRDAENEKIRMDWMEVAVDAARERRKLITLIDVLDEAGYTDPDTDGGA